MRVRIFEIPGMSEFINKNTVPVLVNTTDVGFPEEIECLSWFKDQYHCNPWIRMIYGYYVLINHDGSRYYGSSGCQCLNHNRFGVPYQDSVQQLRTSIRRWKIARKLEKVAEPNKVQIKQLKSIYAQIEKEVSAGQVCGDDMRLLTARYLAGYGAESWDKVLAQLLTPKPGQNEKDPLGARMRVAATRRLGEFVSDATPFTLRHESHMKIIYTNVHIDEYHLVREKVMKEKKLGYVTPEDIPLPPSLKKIAAHSLGKIVEQDWKVDDPKLIEKAKTWWIAHESEDRFRLSTRATSRPSGIK